ncbi:MAG: VOC family protein [Elusimicrobia bacterium]|nr:VOC family protein [Elusimicrobiota bacterium]
MTKTAEKAAAVKGTYGTMYFVKDVLKTAKFLKEKLALKTGYESADWTEFHVGGQSLCLHPEGEKTHAKNGTMILHVDGIRTLAAELKAKGVKVTDVHEVHPGAWSADFTDLDGNVISLYEGPKSC